MHADVFFRHPQLNSLFFEIESCNLLTRCIKIEQISSKVQFKDFFCIFLGETVLFHLVRVQIIVDVFLTTSESKTY